MPSPRLLTEHRVVLTKADIQRLRSLREKKEREAHGLFVVEGEKVVGELITSGFPLLELYATGAWHCPFAPPAGKSAAPFSRGPALVRVTEDEMSRISHFPTPSPVLAVGQIKKRSLGRGELNRGLTLALDGVQDAGNVGTLLRIADWFGLTRVLLSVDCADVFHQKVINASMGSFARVETHRVDLVATLNGVADHVPILGCDLDGRNVYSLAPLRDAILVIGSEGRGLSPEVAARLTERVTIPRFGKAESLNAAVAAGIVCACVRRGG